MSGKVSRMERALVEYYYRRLHPDPQAAAQSDLQICRAAQGPHKRVREAIKTRHLAAAWGLQVPHCHECGRMGTDKHWSWCPNWECK